MVLLQGTLVQVKRDCSGIEGTLQALVGLLFQVLLSGVCLSSVIMHFSFVGFFFGTLLLDLFWKMW